MADKKMLNFKMGPVATLGSVSKSAGTIYVTTDEGAMYVDVDNSKRIRLGGAVIVAQNVEALADLQPWQTGCLYYCSSEDVLAVWNGSDWKLVNDAYITRLGTAEAAIENQGNLISTQGESITSIQGSLKTVQDTLGTITKDGDTDTVGEWLSKLNTKTGANEASIKDLQDTIAALTGGEGAGSLAELKQLINGVSDVANANAASIKTINSSIEGINGSIGTLQTNLGTLQGQHDSVASDVSTIKGDYLKSTDKTALETKITDAENLVTAEKDRAVARENEIAEAVEGHGTEISGLKTTTEALTTNLEAITTRVGTAESDISELKNADSELLGALNGVSAIVTTHGTNIASLQGTTENHTSRIEVLEGAKDNYIAADAALKAEIKLAYEAADATLTSNLNTLSTKVDGIDTAYKAADAALDKAYKDADAQIRVDYAAADADLSELIEANTTNIAALAGVVGDGQDGLVKDITELKEFKNQSEAKFDSIDGSIESIDGKIESIKKDYATKQELNTTKSGLEQTIGGVSEVANKNKNDLSSLSGTVNTLSTTVDKKANAADVEASIKTINDNAAALGDRVSANEKSITDIQKDIKDVVKVNIATNAGLIAANADNINANAASINTNAGNITKNTQSITNILNGTKLDSFKDVEDEIVRAIGASNAMVFKGVLGGTDGLAQVPTTNEQGWTYKVAAAGTYAGYTCKVGDLLIALKDNATTASADWAYIPSGGEDFDNVVLSSEANSTSIKISDDLNHVHGSVEIASENESLEIDGSVADKISINMVWGTWN